MTKLGLVRAVSAAVAAVAAPVALAAGAEPSFAVSSTGIWSVIGVALGSGALVWVMKKVQ